QVEPMNIRPPEDGEVGGAGAAPPQPELLRDAGLARQPLHLDQHERPANHRPGTSTTSGRMVLRLRMHIAPRPHSHCPVLRVLLAMLGCWGPPGGRLVTGELPAMAARPPGARLTVGIG